MASVLDNDDDSLIIILGTSPGASMDVKRCNGVANGELDKSQIEDAMKELSNEANMAFKAQFHLGDSPSPASMMVASTIITEDRSTEELQKRFGDIIDENVVLKETLKQNNDSMKEQFMLIASCQEDMLKTHRLHKEKFDETRELVERLRQENKQLKLDISRLAEGDHTNIGEHKKTSGFELVTSPEDDTLEKLTLQLELVEKQRRQVILDNEKLTWQKESLEHIVDAISKERDDARLKLQNVELLLSTKETEHIEDTKKLHNIISDLQNKMKEQSSNISAEDDSKRELVQQLESKLAALRQELKTALMKIHALENVKLEFSQYKSGASETVKMYKEQILELNNRIKEVQSTVFQPVRLSVSSENTSSEFASHMSNIKLYDRTLKHLAELLNGLAHGLSDSLAHTLGVVSSLHELKYEPGNTDTLRTGLGDLKNNVQTQHSTVVSNIGQIRGTLSIFEGIFKDHNELLKKTLTKTETSSPSVQQLTAALVARGQQLTALQEELSAAREHADETDVLRAQVELYKSDFEAERESREKMASEKENLLADLRVAQKKIQDLTTQLEELRVLSPSLHRSITTMRPRPASRPPSTTSPTTSPTTTPAAAAGTATYTCPKCMTFSSSKYAAMEEHFEYCLDDF